MFWMLEPSGVVAKEPKSRNRLRDHANPRGDPSAMTM
jgi:hypothetical protein